MWCFGICWNRLAVAVEHPRREYWELPYAAHIIASYIKAFDSDHHESYLASITTNWLSIRPGHKTGFEEIASRRYYNYCLAALPNYNPCVLPDEPQSTHRHIQLASSSRYTFALPVKISGFQQLSQTSFCMRTTPSPFLEATKGKGSWSAPW